MLPGFTGAHPVVAANVVRDPLDRLAPRSGWRRRRRSGCPEKGCDFQEQRKDVVAALTAAGLFDHHGHGVRRRVGYSKTGCRWIRRGGSPVDRIGEVQPRRSVACVRSQVGQRSTPAEGEASRCSRRWRKSSTRCARRVASWPPTISTGMLSRRMIESPECGTSMVKASFPSAFSRNPTLAAVARNCASGDGAARCWRAR